MQTDGSDDNTFIYIFISITITWEKRWAQDGRKEVERIKTRKNERERERGGSEKNWNVREQGLEKGRKRGISNAVQQSMGLLSCEKLCTWIIQLYTFECNWYACLSKVFNASERNENSNRSENKQKTLLVLNSNSLGINAFVRKCWLLFMSDAATFQCSLFSLCQKKTQKSFFACVWMRILRWSFIKVKKIPSPCLRYK